MPAISRRDVLKSTAALGLGGILGGIGWGIVGARATVHQDQASPLGIADDLANPAELHSVDGRLHADLYMSISDQTLPSGPAQLRIFNDTLPAPTLRLQPGDTLEVAFENRMPPNPDRRDITVNVPNRFNTTNIHYHGFHVSPLGNSDNVYLEIEPGQRFNYVVQLPQDHPAGSYWYHPHRHGSVSAQVASGAAGMAIIGGALDEVPEIAAAVERILVLQAPVPGIDGVLDDEEPIWALTAERDFLVNGQFRPRIYIRQGEVQHWRVLHAGDAQFLPLRADGLEIYEVGRDGNPLQSAQLTELVDLAPGNRADLLVKAGDLGHYTLLRPAFNQGTQAMPEFVMADIFVIAADDPRVAPGIDFGTEIPTGELPDNDILVDIEDDEITGHRTFVLGVSDVKGYFHDTLFTINDQSFDPGRDDVVTKLGAVEEWTLVNTTPFPHPLHIHVNPFQLVEINGEPAPGKPWLDTVPVPAAGSVKFRTRFLDFPGRFVMHCHILPHEDTGMMININIQA
jgi:FtsP/CotA-like multicopper oxidase with cupredoxin domain